MKIDPTYILLAAIMVSFALMQMNHRAPSPVTALVNRWLRWAIFSTGLAYLFYDWEITGHPYWMLVIIFAVLWFLCETLYNWVAIKALSASSLPLFPKFSAGGSGEEWPTHPRFSKTREQVRDAGFRHVQSVRAQIAEGAHMRVSIYHDMQQRTRLQITFIPLPNGAMATFASCTSITRIGHRFVTDNAFLPFAGFYPEAWYVERNPWRRSIAGLLARHAKRLEKNGEPLETLAADPVEDLNMQQGVIEQLNIKLGFFRPHHEREEFGRFTSAACYRVWKEIWTLNYLGRSTRYV